MRIHTNTIERHQIYAAARFSRVDLVDFTDHGSRSRSRAFNVKLEGESRRRPNGGSSGVAYGSDYAATWDQWGVFLSVLFDVDPDMICGSAKRPHYRDRHGFHFQTDDRFTAPVLGFGPSDNYHVVNGRAYHDPSVVVHRLGASYWPDDAHGDHRFQFSGTVGQQECTKCSAIQRWSL